MCLQKRYFFLIQIKVCGIFSKIRQLNCFSIFIFDVNNDFYPRINGFTGGVEADGNGNFVGDIIVDTSSTEEEDPYDEEFEDEYEPEDEE